MRIMTIPHDIVRTFYYFFPQDFAKTVTAWVISQHSMFKLLSLLVIIIWFTHNDIYHILGFYTEKIVLNNSDTFSQ